MTRSALSPLLALLSVFVVTAAAESPSIEGTYKLTSRKLPDGTILNPPQVMGLLTYTKTHRNFNIVQTDATGKFRSLSIVSTYTLTPTEYSETLIFTILSDQVAGKEPVYDVSVKTRTVPVKIESGRIEFKPPFDVPSLVFEGSKVTAIRDGRVDVWEKVP